MAESTSVAMRAFVVTLNSYIEEGGYGIQKKVAEALGISPVHLNDILKGRKNASINLQEKIANYFKKPLDEFTRSGRMFIEHNQKFLNEKLRHLEKNSSARADAIYRIAIEETMGVKDFSMMTTGILSASYPKGWEMYLAGRITEEELLNMARKWAKELKRFLSKQGESDDEESQAIRTTKARRMLVRS